MTPPTHPEWSDGTPILIGQTGTFLCANSAQSTHFDVIVVGVEAVGDTWDLTVMDHPDSYSHYEFTITTDDTATRTP